MKVAYIDCSSGISGDMILGALIDGGVDISHLRNVLSGLGIEFELVAKEVFKNHIRAVKVDVVWDKKHHHHRHLSDIEKIIESSSLSDFVKSRSMEIFKVIADAESRVHGVPVEEVHFHEVGAVDSIVDVVGSVVGFEALGIDRLFVSSLNVGKGRAKCAHGELPIPAPATSIILRGMPVYSDGTEGELTTPTGAAIVKVLSSGFCDMPSMNLESISFGAGSMDLPFPNILRMFIGVIGSQSEYEVDERYLLETDIDDATPEVMGFTADRLMKEGALDVLFIPVFMKKMRPGFRLSVITDSDKLDRILHFLFEETTTFGIRFSKVKRYKLSREEKEISTSLGTVRVKVGMSGSKVVTVSPEYESCKLLAEKGGVSLKYVYDLVKQEIANKFYNKGV